MRILTVQCTYAFPQLHCICLQWRWCVCTSTSRSCCRTTNCWRPTMHCIFELLYTILSVCRAIASFLRTGVLSTAVLTSPACL